MRFTFVDEMVMGPSHCDASLRRDHNNGIVGYFQYFMGLLRLFAGDARWYITSLYVKPPTKQGF